MIYTFETNSVCTHNICHFPSYTCNIDDKTICNSNNSCKWLESSNMCIPTTECSNINVMTDCNAKTICEWSNIK